jgi:branched-chain amino acid transport system permease protein
MLSATAIGFILYVSMLILLCTGFTFTHMMEGFPNLAHTSFATIGTMCAYHTVRLWGLNPYLAWPSAAFLNGLVGVAIYLTIVRPIRNGGSGEIRLTFALFSLTFIIRSLLSIYSYWVLMSQGFRASGFMLRSYDFEFMGLPGIVIMAPLASLLLVSSLHLFLTKTKFGIAIKATSEDRELASTLGINIQRVHIASWFITGALAGIAGATIPLWEYTSLGSSDQMMINVMAGSVLGGLDSIYGAMIGGTLFAITHVYLPGLLVRPFGPWITKYKPLVPILVIILILMFEPRGVTGLSSRLSAYGAKLGGLHTRLGRRDD